jgi:TetR/AcrR family transcriptional repressor of mexJK operon
MSTRGAIGNPARGRSAVARRGRPLDAEKHRQILAAATQIFLARGFAGTSMDLVARRAGVSKVTVYTHFHNKEALFGAIIHDLAAGLVARIEEMALRDQAPGPALRQFGRRYLELALAESSVALHRTIVAESARLPRLGRLIYDCGPTQVVRALARFLGASKALRLRNPQLAAEQFLGMVLGHAQLRLLLSGRPPAEVRAGIEATVDHAVDLFLNGALAGSPPDFPAGSA